MQKTLLFVLIFLGLSVKSYTQNKSTDNKKLSLDEIEKIVAADSTMCNTFPDLEQMGFQINYSPDNKIRLFSWKTEKPEYNRRYSPFIIQYKVAPNKTKIFSHNKHYSDYVLKDKYSYEAIDMYMQPDTLSYLNQIYHIRDGLYIISAQTPIDTLDSGEIVFEHTLFGFDIGRGKLKKAYLFTNENDRPINYFSYRLKTKNIYNPSSFEIIGSRLEVPKTNSEGNFNKEYSVFHFNGASFENEQQYYQRLTESGSKPKIITRLYYKDENNMSYTTTTCPRCRTSLILEITSDSIAQIEGETNKITLKADEKLILNYPYLKTFNGYCFIESMGLYELEETKEDYSSWYTKEKDLNVAYITGREWAEPYEILRYSALKFTRKTTEKEQNSVQWAIEIDGKLKYLDSDPYSGNQIDLQMKEEWLGKTIKVFAYIDKLNRNIFQETEITDKKDHNHY